MKEFVNTIQQEFKVTQICEYQIKKVKDYYKFIYDDVLLMKFKLTSSNFDFIIFEILNENRVDYIKPPVLKDIILKFMEADCSIEQEIKRLLQE